MASTISVPVGTQASQAWSARDANVSGINTVLLMNTDLINTVMVGNAVNAVVVPIAPNGSLSVDPGENWYVQGPVAGAGPLVIVPNGQSNFLGLTQSLGALAIPSVRSPNFNLSNPAASPNPSWAILKSGVAYFVGLVLFGGTITGPDYIINTNGIFVYSGTPAFGNLIESWAFGAAGNDGFGNPYPTGITIGNSSGPQVNIQSSGGSGVIQFLLNSATFQNAGFRAVAAGFAQVLFNGPANKTVGFTDLVATEYNSSDGVGSANMDFSYSDINGINHFYANYGANAFSIIANSVIGVHPGTGNIATPAVGESWQTPALVNNWQSGGHVPGGIRYQMSPLFGGSIFIEGDIFNAVIGVPSSSICATFGAPYITALNGLTRNIPAQLNQNVVNNSASSPWIFIDGGGNINVTAYELGNRELFFQGYIPLT